MIKVIRAEFKLSGTENEIERVKAKIASLSILEEVVSLYIREEDPGKRKIWRGEY